MLHSNLPIFFVVFILYSIFFRNLGRESDRLLPYSNDIKRSILFHLCAHEILPCSPLFNYPSDDAQHHTNSKISPLRPFKPSSTSVYFLAH